MSEKSRKSTAERIPQALDLTQHLVQPALNQLGLVKALDALVGEYDSQHAVEFRFELRNGDRRHQFARDVSDTVYRGVRELLHNVVKHADASRATVRLEHSESQLRVEIEDDGAGMSMGDLQPSSVKIGGFGLFNFRERVRQLGGDIEIRSATGDGCRVTMQMPLRKSEAG